MLRQHTIPIHMIALMVVALSVLPLSAFARGVRDISVYQKNGGSGTNQYIFTALHSPYNQCITDISPWSVTIKPSDKKIIHISYLSKGDHCIAFPFMLSEHPAIQMFKVFNKKYPKKFVYIVWGKSIGEEPHAWVYSGEKGLVSISNKDGKHIKIWVGGNK